MATFDLDTFATLTGQGRGVVGALGTSFGMPACMLELTEDLLGLIPSPILRDMNKAADKGREKANQVTASIFNEITFGTGIISFSTETGQISFGSNSSDLDAGSDEQGFVEDVEAFTSAVGYAVGVGTQLYKNYENAEAKFNQINRCVSGYLNTKKYTGGLAANERQRLNEQQYQEAVAQKLAKYKNTLADAKEKRDAFARLSRAINTQLAKREEDPSLEPEFTAEFADILSGTNFKIEDPDEETGPELIRLVFGPPVSSKGKYLLSTDGLYYDAQTDESVEPILLALTDRKAKLKAAEKWKFNFDPNLGGKGDQISSRNFYEWVDTIFDETVIDDGINLFDHYQKDHFLKVLEGQKEKRILDINAQIETLVESGASEAVIENYKQSLISEVAYHNDKMNRRKKQIEIAVKAPLIFGKGDSPLPGKVPINDFSYLQNCNIALALDKQKKLILDQASVSGIVMPIRPTFVVSKAQDSQENIEHLYVPEVGLGAIITDTRNAANSSSIELAISDVITEDGLFAVYNFLNSKTTTPSSSDFSVLNCVTTDDYNNAQLVAPNAQFVFGEDANATFGYGYGLGSAYMQGITRNSGTNPSALGSYVKMPDTPEFQDWLYNRSGASFDTWVYAPHIAKFADSWDDGLSTSSLYRLILSCENTGILSGVDRKRGISEVQITDGSEYTKGMIMGFTRDRRWINNEEPTNDGSVQHPRNGGFILAPTVSYDISSIAFGRTAEVSRDGCLTGSGWAGMFVAFSATTSSGKSLSSCGESFCNIAVTFDYEKDRVSLYLDSELLSTSSISRVFGTPATHSIKLPTFKKSNSFEYGPNTVGPLAPNSLRSGPKLGSYFTPWILGGGYTDGMASYGNFMGGEYNGVNSGLKGYLGSTKFYSKPLEPSEINFNYSIQQKLYKNLEASLPPTVRLIIAIGQSNMDGNFVPIGSSEVPAKYKETQLGKKIWMPDSLGTSAGSWLDNNPVNFENTTYGGYNQSRYFITEPAYRFDSVFNGNNLFFHYDMLLPFMDTLYEHEGGNNVYLIKNAKNSTAMVSGLNSPQNILSWTDENTLATGIQGSALYDTLARDVSAAVSALRAQVGPYAVIDPTILMIQGEFDSYHFTGQFNYPTPTDIPNSWGHYFSSMLYSKLQTDLKNALNDPTADDYPWIIGRTHTEMTQPMVEPLEQLPYYVSIVRAQQQAIANDLSLNVHLVDLDGVNNFVKTTPSDESKIHFNASGLGIVADRFWDKYKEVKGLS